MLLMYDCFSASEGCGLEVQYVSMCWHFILWLIYLPEMYPDCGQQQKKCLPQSEDDLERKAKTPQPAGAKFISSLMKRGF